MEQHLFGAISLVTCRKSIRVRWGSYNSNENKIYVYFIVCAGDHFRSLLESFSGSETIFCGILTGICGFTRHSQYLPEHICLKTWPSYPACLFRSNDRLKRWSNWGTAERKGHKVSFLEETQAGLLHRHAGFVGSLNLGLGQPAYKRLYGWWEPGPGDSLGFRAGLCPSPMVLGLSPHLPMCSSPCACPAKHFFKLSISLIEALLYPFWDQISFLMTKDKSYLSFLVKSAQLCQLEGRQQQCYLPSLFIA